MSVHRLAKAVEPGVELMPGLRPTKRRACAHGDPLLLVGGALPLLWPELDWRHVTVALALIFLIRPLAGWISLNGTDLLDRERLVVAAYGVRGIGSIYYLGYATSHLSFVNEGQLWATIALTILISTIVHGLTAGAAVRRVTKEEDRSPSPGK